MENIRNNSIQERMLCRRIGKNRTDKSHDVHSSCFLSTKRRIKKMKEWTKITVKIDTKYCRRHRCENKSRDRYLFNYHIVNAYAFENKIFSGIDWLLATQNYYYLLFVHCAFVKLKLKLQIARTGQTVIVWVCHRELLVRW